MISLLVAEPGTVLTVGTDGYGKRTPVEEFPTRGRGAKGVISMRINEDNGEQVGAVLVRPGDEIMLITEAGTLVRTGVDGISILGRNTRGVRLINLGEHQRLAGIERVVALNGGADDANGADVTGSVAPPVPSALEPNADLQDIDAGSGQAPGDVSDDSPDSGSESAADEPDGID